VDNGLSFESIYFVAAIAIADDLWLVLADGVIGVITLCSSLSSALHCSKTI
jgi:hypothetical protein